MLFLRNNNNTSFINDHYGDAGDDDDDDKDDDMQIIHDDVWCPAGCSIAHKHRFRSRVRAAETIALRSLSQFCLTAKDLPTPVPVLIKNICRGFSTPSSS